MPNDSSTGGYLVPGGPLTSPLQTKSLYNFITAVVVGITGLPSALVIPAYQSEPPVVPDAGTVWAAVAITERRVPTFAVEAHVVGSPSYDYVQQQEELDVLVSVYGLGVEGGADAVASQLREGLQVAQNREALQLAGWALGYTGAIRPAPTLDAVRWNYRLDLPITFRRELNVSYSVLDVGSMIGTLQTDAGTPPFSEPISVHNP